MCRSGQDQESGSSIDDGIWDVTSVLKRGRGSTGGIPAYSWQSGGMADRSRCLL